MSIEIEKILRENKPEITESTIKAYMLNLQKLHDRLHGTKEFSDIECLKQSDDVKTIRFREFRFPKISFLYI